jgi:hypothetical protein
MPMIRSGLSPAIRSRFEPAARGAAGDLGDGPPAVEELREDVLLARVVDADGVLAQVEHRVLRERADRDHALRVHRDLHHRVADGEVPAGVWRGGRGRRAGGQPGEAEGACAPGEEPTPVERVLQGVHDHEHSPRVRIG